MHLNGLLYTFPKEIKLLIGAFLVVLSIGFYSGLLFVNETSSMHGTGIEEHYLGNENDEDATTMKFKKSEREMLSIVHSHILSMALIFFALGLILATTQLHKNLKTFLIVEPFVSIILTFGGISLLWKGTLWMKHVVMFSGILMTTTYTVSILIIFSQLVKRK